MNSLRYLPCFCLIEKAFLFSSLQSAFPPILSSPRSLCALNQHKFAFIVFICLFTLISFPFQRLPIRDLQTSEAEWHGSYGLTFVCVCVQECVFLGKIKIQIERKRWNHHFCYRQLCFTVPSVNKLLQGAETEDARMYSFHHSKQYILKSFINTRQDLLQRPWKSFSALRLQTVCKELLQQRDSTLRYRQKMILQQILSLVISYLLSEVNN